MSKDFTTIPIKKTTHQVVKKLMDGKNMTWDDVVLSFSENAENRIKQVLVTVDVKQYETMLGFARIAYEKKLIKAPTIEDFILLLVDNSVENAKLSSKPAEPPQPQYPNDYDSNVKIQGP